MTRRAAAGKTVDATSLLCSYGFSAPVGKAMDHLVKIGALVEVGKTSLGHPLYKAAA